MKTKLPNFEAVIFDMDGVIVHSEPFYAKIERALFQKVGAPVTQEEHLRYQGTSNDLMWMQVKERHGLKQTVEELVEMSNSRITPFFKSLDIIEPMENLPDLLQALKEKEIPIALATSSYADVIEIVLKKTGLEKYFKVAVSSQYVSSSKPEPDIFLYAAKKLQTAPEKCLVIEDSTNGIKAAKRADMFCIAYAGPGTEHQNQSEADWIIQDYSELTQVIKNISV